MNSNAYDVFYLQYSHQHVAAAEDGRNRVRNMLERKLCTKIHHKYCSAFCWLFVRYITLLPTEVYPSLYIKNAVASTWLNTVIAFSRRRDLWTEPQLYPPHFL